MALALNYTRRLRYHYSKRPNQIYLYPPIYIYIYTDCISVEGQDFPERFPGYDTKLSDGEASVMLELWRMRSTPSLPSLQGPLWPGGVTFDSVLSVGKIELN